MEIGHREEEGGEVKLTSGVVVGGVGAITPAPSPKNIACQKFFVQKYDILG